MPPDREAEKAFLRTVPIFGGLEEAPLERLLGMFREVDLPVGEEACGEGENGRNMFVVREGEVEVVLTTAHGERVPIVRLGAGDCFGEMTLIEMQGRSATVAATKPTRLYGLSKANLFQLYREDVHTYVLLLQNICRELARRLRKADGRIAELLEAESSRLPKS
jgi:CRP/FNR family cyclic AMP-dependent transcriptional regulator